MIPNLLHLPRVRVTSDEDAAKITGPSTQMAVALNRRGITYERPCSAEVARRRKKGKAQRLARKVHRGRR